MAYNQASIMARMFDELVSHSVTIRNLIVLAESLNIPAGLDRGYIFPFLHLLLILGPLVGVLIPPLLLLLHIIIPLFLDFGFKIFHGLIH